MRGQRRGAGCQGRLVPQPWAGLGRVPAGSGHAAGGRQRLEKPQHALPRGPASEGRSLHPCSQPLPHHPLPRYHPQLPETPDPAAAHPAYRPGAGAAAGGDYGRALLLTDIEGMEDHLGDMDFKVGRGPGFDHTRGLFVDGVAW